MDLYLQLGFGMMAHAKELISKWGGGTVIFSPKDMTLDQMKTTANEIQKSKGKVLIDPQFYIPRTGHENLQFHSFWPTEYNTNVFFNSSGIDNMLSKLIDEYINPIHASAFIIPTLYLKDITDDWYNITDIIINSLQKQQITIPKYLTICVGDDVLKNEDKTHQIHEKMEDYPVEGFYIIPKHPNDSYLVDDISWLVNLLDFIAGLKTLKKKVIVGYSHHQFLFLSLGQVDAICAGTWLKTRMFPLRHPYPGFEHS